MSARRRSPLAAPTASASRELERCEATIALLDRARPLNLAAEVARLTSAFERGARPAPALAYRPRAQLAELRRALLDAARRLEAGDAEERLLSGRALELELEARLAENVGSSAFAALAAQRFPLPDDAEATRRLATRFLSAAPELGEGTFDSLHVSDDPRDPDSLWSRIARRIAAERWPVRVEVVPGLVSLAAVADGVVRVRGGARLSARVAERIALHEVEGHVRPRISGARLGGAFLAGTPRSSEDEEGRAIFLEERAGLLGYERRRELARRYLAAESLRQGAELWETVDVLVGSGAAGAAAIELACRVHRGGGLGREVVYLAGYARVSPRLAREPELDRAMSCGRLSLEGADQLGQLLELDDDRNVI